MNTIGYDTQQNYKDLFLCLDWDQEIVLKPNYSGYLSLRLEKTCDTRPNQNFGFDDECISDLDQQIAYIDPDESGIYRTYLYYNYETFEAGQYGE